MPSLPQAVLRLPNPKGDIDSLVSAYGVLYADLSGREDFDIDDGVATLIANRMLSSSGAVGQEALRRSTREDRSRDPLFNQFKMFSELYRLLGWLHSTSSRARFTCTSFGRYIAEYDGDVRRGLVEEALVGIALPNAHSENLGVENLRPFGRLLELMLAADGELTRDEMIIGVYTIADDQVAKIVESRAQLIRKLRRDGSYANVDALLVQAANGRQVNTLHNYTRFMIGAINGVRWTVEDRRDTPYDCSVKFFRLTAHGRAKAEAVAERTDVRQSHLEDFGVDVRAAMCVVGQIGLLVRAGVALDEPHELALREALASLPAPLRASLPSDYAAIEFSPYQQADAAALRLVEAR
jgi:hypothetical protein